MPGLTSSNTSDTEYEKLFAIGQEINRLGLKLGEEGFPSTEKTKLLAFFAGNLSNTKLINVVLNFLSTIPDDKYTERVSFLKKVSSSMFTYKLCGLAFGFIFSSSLSCFPIIPNTYITLYLLLRSKVIRVK
jgi:hypothetical protein